MLTHYIPIAILMRFLCHKFGICGKKYMTRAMNYMKNKMLINMSEMERGLTGQTNGKDDCQNEVKLHVGSNQENQLIELPI